MNVICSLLNDLVTSAQDHDQRKTILESLTTATAEVKDKLASQDQSCHGFAAQVKLDEAKMSVLYDAMLTSEDEEERRAAKSVIANLTKLVDVESLVALNRRSMTDLDFAKEDHVQVMDAVLRRVSKSDEAIQATMAQQQLRAGVVNFLRQTLAESQSSN